jgi:SAM-dependent methyltransferase
MLAQAKMKNSKALLILGNALFMPFGEETFDAAYCIQVLHHIADKSRFTSEVYRILQRGGRCVIQSCSHEQLSTFWFYHYFPRGLERDRMRIPDFREISDLLAQAGFMNISVHPCPFEGVFRETPELYLDKRYRDGTSTFSLLTTKEIEAGCERMTQDIQSGRAAEVIAAFDRKAEHIGGRVSFIRSIKP